MTKFITTHKNACRVAKFSPDGKYVATGSADTSIKLLDVNKMKSYNQTKSEYGEDFAPARPVTRTFYDHTQVSERACICVLMQEKAINDLDFHPAVPILISCGKDASIKFYDYSQSTVKRSFKYIQVRSESFIQY